MTAEDDDRVPWTAWVLLVLAITWWWGIGSVAAAIGAGVSLGAHPSPRHRRVLLAALTIGIVGTVTTLVAYGLLGGATSSEAVP